MSNRIVTHSMVRQFSAEALECVRQGPGGSNLVIVPAIERLHTEHHTGCSPQKTVAHRTG